MIDPRNGLVTPHWPTRTWSKFLLANALPGALWKRLLLLAEMVGSNWQGNLASWDYLCHSKSGGPCLRLSRPRPRRQRDSWQYQTPEANRSFGFLHGLLGLPWWFSGKELACQYGRCAFSSWVGKIPCRRKWQPAPVFLPGKSHGQRSSVGYSLGGCKIL